MSPIDPTFRLSAAERSQLHPHIDHDAVERYLQHFTAQQRPPLLNLFMERRAILMRVQMPGSADAERILDEIYAPMWEWCGEEAIERETTDYPGRELARARLRKRREEDDQTDKG